MTPLNDSGFEERIDEYKKKCQKVKDFYRRGVIKCGNTDDLIIDGGLTAIKREELRVLDEQFRDGKPMIGKSIALK